MRRDNNLFWVGLFVLSILGTFFVIYKKNQTKKEVLMFENTQAVEEFLVGKIKIKKSNENWFLEYEGQTEPADKNIVEAFLKRASGVNLEKVVSSNKERDSLFGIDPNSITLSIAGREYLIGWMGKRYESTFVKPKNEDKVYEVATIWGNGEIASRNFWALSRANNWPVLQIESVKIENKEFKPKDGTWANNNWIYRLAYLPLGKYLGTTAPNKEKVYKFQAIINGKEEILEIAKYWTKVGNNFYEIKKEDFELLTSVTK